MQEMPDQFYGRIIKRKLVELNMDRAETGISETAVSSLRADVGKKKFASFAQ
jgi:hypothetical protein